MDVVTTVADLADALAGDPCVLVPTMGALHAGHESLMHLGRRVADDRGVPLAASIFVNPAQFNDPADLERYPRPLVKDLDRLLSSGVEIVFAPPAAEVYPPHDPTAAPQPPLPPVASEPGLEDRYRLGHFAGVCRVVSRLFDLFAPEAAVFGEKDWQQLRVVAAMCAMQDRDIEIVPGPTVREPGGLAMSSRNEQLSSEGRERARAISRAIERCRAERDPVLAASLLAGTIESAGLSVEYAVVRDAATLRINAAAGGPGPWRALVAARLEGVRLLDNAQWPA